MAHVPATNEKVCLVVGGNGALGQAVVNKFRSKGWIVVSADKTYVRAASASTCAGYSFRFIGFELQ